MPQSPRMNRLTRFAVAIFAFAGLIGCGAQAVTEGGKPRPKVYQNVVSLSPGTTEIISSTNFTQVLKGRTAADDFPQSALSAPVVASVKPDYELLAEMKPDLIVYDSQLYNESDVEKIKALGADTFVFESNTLDGFIEELYKLAALLGSEVNTISYIENIYRERNSALGDAPENRPKLAIVLPGDGTEHLIAGTKSFAANMAAEAGAQPVGPDADRFVPLSPEAFIQQNPAVIVVPYTRVPGDDATSRNNARRSAQKLLDDPRFKNVQAVVNGQMIAIDEDVLTRRGFRVNQLIEGIRRRLPQN